MKNKIVSAIIFASISTLAQVPTGSPAPFAGNPNQAVTTSNFAWYRGGNNATGPAGANNIFGTASGFNSPIYTQTNGQNRTKLNGTLNYPINAGANLPRNGFMLLGDNNALPNGGSLYGANRGAFSLLHLNGLNQNGFAQEGGFRDWMRYGITSTHNQDLMYIGQRATGGADITDAVIGWADNSGGAFGPDNMVFNYLSGAQGGTNDLNGLGNFGREIMRLSGGGNIGIGPRFNNTWQPQSTLHQHQENAVSSWMQITNQGTGNVASATAPTAITANDGLRWGILGNQILNQNGNAFIYNQENRHLIFSTNNAVPTDMSATNERMRITHIGAPGTPNPGAVPQNRTRVSISHNPAQPIVNPLSLLHLGYNTGIPFTTNAFDGWRSWMDVGAFIAQGSDNMYVGLKSEPGGFNNDRQDAVISWGDNYNNINNLSTGIDKLRIIFTSPSAGLTNLAGPGDMGSQNGLEFVRFVPFHNTIINRNDPRMGVGNFEQLAIDPQNTLHVNSVNNFNSPNGGGQVAGLGAPTGHSGIRLHDLRSIAIPRANPGLGVLSVDSIGDIIYVPGGGSGNANNGLSVNGTNVQLGGDCGNAAAAALTSNREIPMNGFNLNFTNPVNSSSQVLFGFPACNTVSAKLVANNDFHQAGIAGVTTVNSANPAVGVFGQTSNSGSGLSIGVYGLANASGASNAIGVNCEANGGTSSNVGVNGISNAGGAASNLAVNGTARNANILSIAGNLDVENSSSPTNIGHQSDVRFGTNPTSNNFGSQLKVNTIGANNYGVSAEAFGGTVNYAIFAATGASSNQSPPTGPNYAGYFNGDVVRTGTDNFTSDQNLKQNINPINNALSIINQLSPKTFEYKQANYPSMRLPSGIQYGLIAQEVQAILPELVNNNVHPPVFDSVGNIVTPAVNYLSLEYQQFMGILIKAIQEQQKTIDSLSTKQTKQDSINNAVQAQLAALASQLNGCCTNAAAKVNQAPSQTQKTIHQLEVELSDKDAIVLEQNVPNPFAEQTTILYNIPTSVGKAQILFYNSAGQIIKSVDVTNRGNGKLIVFANDLSSGLYHYTLVADGKVVDSKKMVRE